MELDPLEQVWGVIAKTCADRDVGSTVPPGPICACLSEVSGLRLFARRLCWPELLYGGHEDQALDIEHVPNVDALSLHLSLEMAGKREMVLVLLGDRRPWLGVVSQSLLQTLEGM